MVDFVQKFGGLPSGSLVKELSELSNLYVDADRVVSGKFFQWLYDLGFAPSQFPGEFINAIVFVHAKSSVGVQDGIARYFTKGDLGDILRSKEKLTQVMKADSMITRVRKMLNESALDKQITLQMLAGVKEAVVEATMNRKGCPEKRSLDEIAHEFSLDFSNKTNADRVHEVNMEPAYPMTDDSVTAAVTYDSDGVATNVGRTVVEMKGFKIGDFVKRRKATAWQQYCISEIHGNGNIDLHIIDEQTGVLDHEKLETVDREEFLNTFTTIADSARIEELEIYPGNDARRSQAFHDLALKSEMIICLHELSMANPPPSLKIMTSPEKRVTALKEYKPHEMLLTPSTMLFGVVDSRANPRAINVMRDFVPTKFLLMPHMQKEFTSAMWHVKTLSDREKCNCELSNRYVKCKSPTSKDKNTNAVITWTFPCATNFKAIGLHEEVALYRPSVEVQPKVGKREAPVQLGSASKRQNK